MKYKCDICGAEYGCASDAEDCERRHRNGGRLYCCVRLWIVGDYDWTYEVTRAEGIPSDDVFIRSVRGYGVPAAVAWCEDLPEAIADVKARICREVLRRMETVARNLRETSGVGQEKKQGERKEATWTKQDRSGQT